MGRPVPEDLGYETDVGSFATVSTRSRPRQLYTSTPGALTWDEALVRPGLLHRTNHCMRIDRCKLQAGNRVLSWGAAGGLGRVATQPVRGRPEPNESASSPREKGEMVKRLGAADFHRQAASSPA